MSNRQKVTLPPAIAELIRAEPRPVDTDSPTAICQRLAEIEDDMARLQPALAQAAFLRLQNRDVIDAIERTIRPEGSNAEERKFSVANQLAVQAGDALAQKSDADAAHAACKEAFEVLDSRRSILQSALKIHLREQEPRHGQGAGQGQKYPQAA